MGLGWGLRVYISNSSGVIHTLRTPVLGSSLQGLLLGVCDQSCLTLCDPMDCSPPGNSVHGIFQA